MSLRYIISISLLCASLAVSGGAWSVAPAKTGILRLDTSDSGFFLALSALYAAPYSELFFTLKSPANESISLSLRHYEPFAKTLRVSLGEEQVDAGLYNEHQQYYRGHVYGEVGSFAFLSIGPGGDAQLRYELDRQEQVIQIRSGDLEFVIARRSLKNAVSPSLFLDDIAIDNDLEWTIPNFANQRVLPRFSVFPVPAGTKVITGNRGWSDVYALEVPEGQSFVGVFNRGQGGAGVVIMKDVEPINNWQSSSCVGANNTDLDNTCVISAPAPGTYYIAAFKYDSDDITLAFNYAEAVSADQYLQATIAIDTDVGFYNSFGNMQAAIDYFVALFAYASDIYKREINTELVIGEVFFSTPYVQTGREDRLREVEGHWKQHRSNVQRTLVAHFSSQNFGGLARRGGLCSTEDGYLVSGVNGNAPIQGGPIVSDAFVLTHEIGHGFDSPHAHCYAGIGGNPLPVDACSTVEAEGDSCWSGPTSLPGINALAGGSSGKRNGTIMSYCAKLPGGIANIAGTFGASHRYGVAPSRVSNLMTRRATEIAAVDPECIALITPPPGC